MEQANAMRAVGALMMFLGSLACSGDPATPCDGDLETCGASPDGDTAEVRAPGSIADCAGILSCQGGCSDEACRAECLAAGTSSASASASAYLSCDEGCRGAPQHFYSCFADNCFDAFSTCRGEQATLSCFRIWHCENDGDSSTRNCAEQAKDAKSLKKFGDLQGCIRANCRDAGDTSSGCIDRVQNEGGPCQAVREACNIDCTTTEDCEPPVCGSGQCTCREGACEPN